jgi:hypothetical protein
MKRQKLKIQRRTVKRSIEKRKTGHPGKTGAKTVAGGEFFRLIFI